MRMGVGVSGQLIRRCDLAGPKPTNALLALLPHAREFTAVGRRRTLAGHKGSREWSVHYTYVPNNGECILKGLRVGNRSW